MLKFCDGCIAPTGEVKKFIVRLEGVMVRGRRRHLCEGCAERASLYYTLKETK